MLVLEPELSPFKNASLQVLNTVTLTRAGVKWAGPNLCQMGSPIIHH